MDNVQLVDTIFQSKDALFIDWDSSFCYFDGFFYIFSMYEDIRNDEIMLVCQCGYDKRLFLKYSSFNKLIVLGSIVYYSNRMYDRNDTKLQKLQTQ